jgi:riboflavin transporter FmnP
VHFIFEEGFILNTRKLTTMGIMAALSGVLVFFVHFPIFPQAAFLEYDPADIPILIITFAYGPLAGLAVTVAASVVQGVTVSAQSGLYGILMHIIATGGYVLTAGALYRVWHSRKGAGISIVCGVLAVVVVMIAANLLITPLFMGVPVEMVQGMLLPVIIPFNVIKAGVNGAVTFLLYKPVSNFLSRYVN